MGHSVLFAKRCFASALLGWGALLLFLAMQSLGAGFGATAVIRYWRYTLPVAVVFLSVGACYGIAGLVKMEAGERKSVLFSSILGILLNVSLIMLLTGAYLLTLLPR